MPVVVIFRYWFIISLLKWINFRGFRNTHKMHNDKMSTTMTTTTVAKWAEMSTRFTYLLLLKLPRNTTNNAVWLSSLHGVVSVSANRHRKRTKGIRWEYNLEKINWINFIWRYSKRIELSYMHTHSYNHGY